MRKNIVLLVSCLLFSASSLFAAEEVKIMSTQDLKDNLHAEDISILDVRSERGWEKSEFKVPGALRATWDNFEEWSGSLPKGNRLVLYCS